MATQHHASRVASTTVGGMCMTKKGITMEAPPAIALLYSRDPEESLVCCLEAQTCPVVDSETAGWLRQFDPEFRTGRVHIKPRGPSDPSLRASLTTGAVVARRHLHTMGLAHDAYGVEVWFQFQPVAAIQDESASLLAALAFAVAHADKQRCQPLPPAFAATGRVALSGQVQRVEYLCLKLEKACTRVCYPPGV